MTNFSELFSAGLVTKEPNPRITKAARKEIAMRTLADKLELAAVKFDARILKRHQRNPRVYHNPHALGLYRARIVQVLDDVARGASPREAIVAGFEGTLRQAMLRACGFPADWSESGELTYRPVTEKE